MTSTVAIVVSGVSFTWEMLILGGLLLSGLIYGFTVGRDRAITVLLSTYVALAIITNTPMLGQLNVLLGLSQSPWLGLLWFFGMFLLVFIILWRSALLRSLGSNRGVWYETLLFSILQVGLFVSIGLFLAPKELLSQVSFVTLEIFTKDTGRTLWLLGPLLLLAVLGRSASGGDTMDLE